MVLKPSASGPSVSVLPHWSLNVPAVESLGSPLALAPSSPRGSVDQRAVVVMSLERLTSGTCAQVLGR